MFPLAVAELNNFGKNSDTEQNCGIIWANLSILHNCAMAPKNKKYMKEAGVIEAIIPYKKDVKPERKMVAMLTLGYIIDETDNNIISADGAIIKFILTCLENGDFQSENGAYQNFIQTHGILNGIMHLASNDNNKVTIVNEGILPMLVALMQTGDKNEKALSAKTVWALSFAHENKDKIRDEPKMMEVLEELSNSSGETKLNASGALWVLSIEKPFCFQDNDENQDEFLQSSFSGPSSSDPANCKSTDRGMLSVTEPNSDLPLKLKHIMISYQWDCQQLMLKIKEKLERENYRVWIDVEKMGGSTLETMAEAIENSAVVLFGVSKKYKDSPNCRTEAEYAYKTGKMLIPVRVEPEYEPDGWLGLLQGSKFYFDFSNPITFGRVFPKLLNELEQKAKVTRTMITNSASAMESLAPHASVVNWSKEKIEKWAARHKISSETVLKLGGGSLKFLCDMKKIAPEFFFKFISEKLGLSAVEDMKNLFYGLNELDL